MRRLIEMFVIWRVSSDFFDQSMASYTCCTPSTASPLMHFGGFLWMHLTLLKRGASPKLPWFISKLAKNAYLGLCLIFWYFTPIFCLSLSQMTFQILMYGKKYILFDSILFSYSKMNELIFAQQKALFVESESWLSNVNFVFLCNFFRKLKQTARK